MQPEHIETIVIGGGQAGLAVGYQLRRLGLPFAILDAQQRVGDAWRNRWDSLRLFSPAAFDGLAGMPYPSSGHSFPTKDEMADYLERYAERFELPVRSGIKIDRLSREGDHFRLSAGPRCFEADNVIVAMANYQQPRTPAFAAELAPDITQLHSSQYRNPTQLQDGAALVVGAGNSGAEIAYELVRSRRTLLSGRYPGAIPFRMDGVAARLLLARVTFGIFHHVLTLDTPVGRRARGNGEARTVPLIRVKPRDLAAAGVEHLPRTVGIRDGRPLLEDGQTADVRNVIWCTGYAPSFAWIDLPVFGEHGPLQRRGVVSSQPGLYFVGLHFQYALSSSQVQGVSRDAAHVAHAIATAVVRDARHHEQGEVHPARDVALQNRIAHVPVPHR